MSHRRNVALKEIPKIKTELEKVERVNSLYACVKELAPTIQERTAQGVPLGRLYEVTAKQIGCSPDAVARHFRRAVTEIENETKVDELQARRKKK
jgi:hypothetical protein